MLRKYMSVVLSMVALLQCIGCTTMSSDFQYKATDIALYSPVEHNAVVQLTDEDIEYLLSLWNDAQWEPDITKTMYDYVFEFGTTIRYSSDYGLFNDVGNQRHFVVSENQRNQINALIHSALNKP